MQKEDDPTFKNSIRPSGVDIKDEKIKKQSLILRKTYKLDKDPYFGTKGSRKYQCILCSTTHNTVHSFVLHRDGKKHQKNLETIEKKYKIKASCIRIRSLSKDQHKGFGLEIKLEKTAKAPKYKFVQGIKEGFLYIEADSYQVIGFKYKGQVVSEYFSEHFDIKEKKYIFQFFIDNQPNTKY